MQIKRVIETCIYSCQLETLKTFYSGVLGLKVVGEEDGKLVFLKAGNSMLLVFNPERTFPSNDILPPHGAYGSTHFALEIEREDYEKWNGRLIENGVTLEREFSWNTAKSLYFRDPASKLVELITPGAWPVE